MVDFQPAKSPQFAKRFSMVPAWLTRYGAISKLAGSDVKVLLVLAARADNTTHICMPSRKTIAKEAGVCASSLGVITNRLSLIGAIEKWRKGNRIHYHVMFLPPTWLSEREHPWLGKDKVPKKSASYLRNLRNGQFSTEKYGAGDVEYFGSGAADEFGDCLKFTSASREQVSSEALQEDLET